MVSYYGCNPMVVVVVGGAAAVVGSAVTDPIRVWSLPTYFVAVYQMMWRVPCYVDRWVSSSLFDDRQCDVTIAAVAPDEEQHTTLDFSDDGPLRSATANNIVDC